MNPYYIIIQKETLEQLQAAVSSLIVDGWKPCGGVTVVAWRHDNQRSVPVLFAQAVERVN